LGLGDSTLVASLVVANYTLVPPFPINLITARQINISSNAFQTYSYTSATGTFDNCIQVLTINAPPYGLITYFNSNQNNTHILRQTQITSIDILITSQDNVLLDFNGQNWTMTFLMEIERNTLGVFPTQLLTPVDKPLPEEEPNPEPEDEELKLLTS
jgi:hypothetical protein